jgi:hypothetical protein
MLRDPKGLSRLVEAKPGKLVASNVGTSRKTLAPTAALNYLAILTATTPTRLPNLALHAPSTTTYEHVSTTTSTPIVMGYADMVVFDQHHDVCKAKDFLVSLEVLRSDLRSIMMWEWCDTEPVIAKMKNRRLIWKRLLERLNDTIVSADGERLERSSDQEEGTLTGCEEEGRAREHSSTGSTKQKEEDVVGEGVQLGILSIG